MGVAARVALQARAGALERLRAIRSGDAPTSPSTRQTRLRRTVHMHEPCVTVLSCPHRTWSEADLRRGRVTVADEPDGLDPDDYLAKSPAASSIGKAAEYLIAAGCVLATRGELVVSLVEDGGVDLVFSRRASAATLAVQVKSRLTDTKVVQRGSYVAFVRAATLEPRPDLDVLFVAVDPDAARLTAAWLVPSTALAETLQPNTRGLLRFVASLKPDTRDRWSGHRLTPDALPVRLAARLAELEPAA